MPAHVEERAERAVRLADYQDGYAGGFGGEVVPRPAQRCPRAHYSGRARRCGVRVLHSPDLLVREGAAVRLRAKLRFIYTD
jgi:hypothetical protein